MLSVILAPASARAANHDHAHGALPHGIPEFCSSPTITSVTSGAWSNPGTWSPARVPGAGDRVAVATNTTVTYDTFSNASLDCVRVTGSLSFRTDTTTRMTVGTMLVMPEGQLVIGSEAAPVAGGVTAELVFAGALNTGTDPEQYGMGLIGVGRVTMHGDFKWPTFARLATEVFGGATQLQLGTTVTGWRAGDRLVLPDTRHLRNGETVDFMVRDPQWEERTVASSSGSAVSLTAGLAYSHTGARDLDGHLDFLPHVGNITRNVILRSQNPAATRGHVLFTHRANVDIRYVAFEDLGRTTTAPLDSTTFTSGGAVQRIGTNQIGRYPVHFHHLMGPVGGQANGYQYTFVGNAVARAPKWGIAIHNTHYGLVQGNVMYAANGAALMTEDGSETGNLIAQNFAIRGTGEGGRDAGGREGVGFYFRGVNNDVRHNVAANFYQPLPDASYGFKFFLQFLGHLRIPAFQGADTSDDGQVTIVDGNAMAIRNFSDNEAYASHSGLTAWWIGAFGERFPRATADSVVRNMNVWHVYNRGVFNYENSRMVYDGLTIRGGAGDGGACCGDGFQGGDYLADSLVIRNADIQGMVTGIIFSQQNGRSTQVVENSFLRNYTNVELTTLTTSFYQVEGILSGRNAILANSRLQAPPASGHFPYRAIALDFRPAPGTRHLTIADSLRVFDYQGVSGDSFRVYYREQAPDFVIPETIWNSDQTMMVAGAPQPGLTNAAAWAQYGIAIAGSVAPCLATRTDIVGFVCPINETYAVAPGSAPQPGPSLPDQPNAPSGSSGGGGGGSSAPSTRTLLITPATGGTVQGPGLTCGSLGSICQVALPSGITVGLEAAPDPGWALSGWSAGCSGGLVVLTADLTCQATFVQTSGGGGGDGGSSTPENSASPGAAASGLARLTITPSAGGTIVGPAITCGVLGTACTVDFPIGIVLGLDAVPAPGSVLSSWSAGCAGGVVSLSGDTTCSPVFSTSSSGGGSSGSGAAPPPPQQSAPQPNAPQPQGPSAPGTSRLTVTWPAGGTVYGAGIVCGTLGAICSVDLPSGAVIGLDAVPDPGSTFVGWSAQCAGGLAPMNGPRTCSPSFSGSTGNSQAPSTPSGSQGASAPPSAVATGLARLSVVRSSGGTVFSAGIVCGDQGASCFVDLPAGTRLGLDATPSPGFVFGGWVGAGCSATISMDQPRSCTPLFTARD